MAVCVCATSGECGPVWIHCVKDLMRHQHGCVNVRGHRWADGLLYQSLICTGHSISYQTAQLSDVLMINNLLSGLWGPSGIWSFQTFLNSTGVCVSWRTLRATPSLNSPPITVHSGVPLLHSAPFRAAPFSQSYRRSSFCSSEHFTDNATLKRSKNKPSSNIKIFPAKCYF